MSEIQAVDWRTPEHQKTLLDAAEEARNIVIEMEKSGQLDWVRAKVFIGLLQTSQFLYSNLISGAKNESVSFCAWCARGLLEAEIWMQYVTTSKENAERFHGDWINDAAELLDCSVSASELNPQQLADMNALYGKAQIAAANECRGEVRAMLAESRESGPLEDEDFLRVSAVAKELGHGQWFGKFNKILSKYVHATAFSVLSLPSEKARTNTSNLMLYEGSNSNVRILGVLNAFFKKQGFRSIYD
jgi:hypothetical protein